MMEAKTPSLSEIHTGIHVCLASSGKTVFDADGSKLFIPASNLKLVTSACALRMLGPRFRFRTDFLTTRDSGTGVRDLVVRGFGDPTIADQTSLELWRSDGGVDKAYNLPHGIEVALERIVERLERCGLREISGDIVVDDSYFENKRLGDGWTVDDEPWFYGSQTGALALNENIVTVVVRPGIRTGIPTTVEAAPDTRFVQLTNRSSTIKSGTANALSFTRVRGSNEIVVTGSLPLGQRRVVRYMTVDDPGLYMGHVLRDILTQRGISVTGIVLRRKIRGNHRLLFRNHSVPLRSIVYWLNKTSDNFYAEQLLKTIGRVVIGEGSWEGGLKVVRKFLRGLGLTTSYRIADGSGLSRYNLVTPRMLTKVLAAMRGDQAFVSSLPVAGEDRGYGTLRKRMKQTPAEGNLRAKTGSIEGVSTLSGYVKTLDDKTLAFSIMTNATVGDLAREKRFQDKIGIVMASNRAKDLPAILLRKCSVLNRS